MSADPRAMSTWAPPSAPPVFRDSKSVWFQRITGLIVLAVALVDFAFGVWAVAVFVAAFGGFELASSAGQVTVDGGDLVLRSFFHDRRVRIADIARVEANFKGYFNRTPHLVLHSGESVALTPFRCSTLLRSRSVTTEQLAERLGLPVDAAGAAFRIGWFVCAAMIVVGVVFGIPLVYAGIVLIVTGGSLVGGLAALVGGGVICAGAVRAIGLQRARAKAAR